MAHLNEDLDFSISKTHGLFILHLFRATPDISSSSIQILVASFERDTPIQPPNTNSQRAVSARRSPLRPLRLLLHAAGALRPAAQHHRLRGASAHRGFPRPKWERVTRRCSDERGARLFVSWAERRHLLDEIVRKQEFE